jgi:hypothetical protein
MAVTFAADGVRDADGRPSPGTLSRWHCYDRCAHPKLEESMKLSSFLPVAVLLAGAAAQAQPPAQSPEAEAARAAVQQSCAADMQSLCPDKKGREAMMCLRSNPDKVSAGCKDALSKMPRPNAPPQ